MPSSLDKLKALASRLQDKTIENNKNRTAASRADKKEERVEKKTLKNLQTAVENIRKENINRVKELYRKLNIYEKSSDFEDIFIYKAMNLSGISLKEEDFAQVRLGKYIQIIAITYEPDKNGKKKAKNISLGYFGKADALAEGLKNEIIEFVLRWRYEKAFQNLEHYKDLIAKVERAAETL